MPTATSKQRNFVQRKTVTNLSWTGDEKAYEAWINRLLDDSRISHVNVRWGEIEVVIRFSFFWQRGIEKNYANARWDFQEICEDTQAPFENDRLFLLDPIIEIQGVARFTWRSKSDMRWVVNYSPEGEA